MYVGTCVHRMVGMQAGRYLQFEHIHDMPNIHQVARGPLHLSRSHKLVLVYVANPKKVTKSHLEKVIRSILQKTNVRKSQM